MRQVNCHIPIKVCVNGRLSDVQLDELGESLVRAVAARTAFAQRTIASRSGNHVQSGKTEFFKDKYDPSREDVTNTYRVSSFRDHGEPTSIPLQPQRRRGGRPWFIRKAINFHASVGDFLDFVEHLTPEESLPDKILYIDRYADLRWVSLWLVQINEDHTLTELEEILFARVTQLSQVHATQILAYGLGTTESIRQQLIKTDKDGVVGREMPGMLPRNARRVVGSGGNTLIRQGGWVLFASMVLPKVVAGEIFSYLNEVAVSLPLHALDFIVDGNSFERLFSINWNDFLSEFGDEPATLRILPVSIKRRVLFRTLKYLIEPTVAANVDLNAAYFGNLYLLNQSRLDWLPAAARTPIRQQTNDLTLALSESQREGWWEPRWIGAFVYAVISPTEQESSLARLQPGGESGGHGEPSETPEHLVDRFTVRGTGVLNVDGLGAYIVGLIRRSPALSGYVQKVLDEVGVLSRDDVSLVFAESASEDDLDSLARSPDGRLLLVRLYDELTSGHLSGSEQEQAERILAARLRSRSIQVTVRRLARSRLIFPFRQPGPTVLDDAPIEAERLADGRIRVTMPVRVAGTSTFHAETRTLPREIFTSGLVLDADEWIKVKLYDEGGIVLQTHALFLLQLSN